MAVHSKEIDAQDDQRYFEVIKRFYQRKGKPLNLCQMLKMDAVLSHDQRRYLAHLANHLADSADPPDPADYYPIFAKHGGGSVIHHDFCDVMAFFYGDFCHRSYREHSRKQYPAESRDESDIRSNIHQCFEKGFYFDAMKGLFKLNRTPLHKSEIRRLNNRDVLSYDQLKYLAHLADYLANSIQRPDPSHYIPLFASYGGGDVVHDDFDDVLGFFLGKSTIRNSCKVSQAINLYKPTIRSKIHRCVGKGFYFDAIVGFFKLRKTQLSNAEIKLLNDKAVLSYDQLEYLARLADYLAENVAEYPDPTAQYLHLFERWDPVKDGDCARQSDFVSALRFFIRASICMSSRIIPTLRILYSSAALIRAN